MDRTAYSETRIGENAVWRFTDRLIASFKAHAILFVVPVLFLLTNLYWMKDLVEPQRATFRGMVISLFEISLPAAIVAMFFVKMFQYAFITKPRSPTRALIDDTLRLLRSPAAFINAIPIMVAMVIFDKAMLDLKPSIPAIKPFVWDETLLKADRLLHFGYDPYVLLQPLLGHPWVTVVISSYYCFWFLVLFAAWYWFAFQKEFSEPRLRFFLAYMLSWWIGGGLMALYFSSAGPVYFGDIGLSPDPFAPLMDYLHEVGKTYPIWALNAQHVLWEGYSVHDVPFLGISAFPSMHTTTAAIVALAGFRIDRRLGWGLTVYCGLILIGSVQLGWHYAVDGYAGILIGCAAWWCAGWLARWNASLPWVKFYRQAE